MASYLSRLLQCKAWQILLQIRLCNFWETFGKILCKTFEENKLLRKRRNQTSLKFPLGKN